VFDCPLHIFFVCFADNETIALDSEICLPILRDISQGLRFLHTADPQILHGDLKAQNILVDSRFHAKVADFGLSQKKHLGGTGTPYWMAPGT
jgi:serine/threonine protein kinase